MSRNPDRGELTVKLEYPTEYNLETTLGAGGGS